jgi:TolA-binding protein
MMLRMILAWMVVVLVVAGCSEQAKDGSRFHVTLSSEAEAMKEGFAVPAASEVDFVEKMATCRNSYMASMSSLVDYYASTGDSMKLRWARRELDSLTNMIKYRYLAPGEIGRTGVLAMNSIDAADKLFAEAKQLYVEAGGLVIIIDEDKLRTALNKFNDLITLYPSSDKVDECAYYTGRIYEHFRDYKIAVRCYQRAFQWSETTPNPARFRAAKIFDRHLHMRSQALTLYQMSLKKETLNKVNKEYAERRIKQLAAPKDASAEQEASEKVD